MYKEEMNMGDDELLVHQETQRKDAVGRRKNRIE
jgi:hypothetical protein